MNILPDGFVDLAQGQSSIQLDLSYAKDTNCMGRPIRGYNTPNCLILTEQAALALQKAEAQFNKDGFTILVYDAYRPQQAVNDIQEWSKNPEDNINEKYFYPHIQKSELFEQGYLIEKSSHSRGSTVDLSLLRLGESFHRFEPVIKKFKNGQEIYFLEDGSINMGTSFDFFGPLSHTGNPNIEVEAQNNRHYLKSVMESCGFEGYSYEWWLFTLKNEPFVGTCFDFPIEEGLIVISN